MSDLVTIYAIADSLNPKLPVYVGRTRLSLKKRMNNHRCRKSPVGDWIRSLRTTGREPVVFALENVQDGNHKEREAHWIRFFRPLGSLLNRSEGDGCKGIKKGPPCLENRLKTIERNKRGLSLQTRSRISASLKGRPMGREAKQKWMSSPGFRVASEKLKQSNDRKKKPVICEETGEKFPSVAEAARAIGCSPERFRESMRSNGRCRGRRWKFLSIFCA